jgi:hypothetical protein
MEVLTDNDAKQLTQDNLSSFSTTNSSRSLIQPTSSLRLLTDLTEEIYANQRKQSQSRSSAYNTSENLANFISDSQNKNKRPKTAPYNRLFQSEASEYNLNEDSKNLITIESLRNDMLNVTENIQTKYETGVYPTKHENSDQSKISKHTCQVCGPDTCRLCEEQMQRKSLNGKSIQSAFTNQSIITVNTKSALSTNYDDSCFYDPDNAKILSILIKNKYNLASSEIEIENMIKNQGLYVMNRSSPYNLKRSISLSRQTTNSIAGRTTMTLPSAAYDNDDETDIFNNDNYTEINPQSIVSNKTTRKLKEFDEPVSTQQTIDKTLKSLKKFNVTEFYFKNMKDLKGKSYFTKDRLLLSRTPVPTSSNKLFLNIERFDIHDRYKEQKMKSALKNEPSKSTKLMKRASLNESFKPHIAIDSFEKYKFISSKKFQVIEPNYTHFYGPPLLQLKMQKFDEIYEKSHHDKNFKLINRKFKN